MEYWNVYDRAGSWTGRTVPKGTPFLPEEYHPAMEAWIVNGRGELLIQRRSPDCEVLPGIWGMTTGRMSAPPPPAEGPLSEPEGGWVDRGETALEGCIREIGEELGLSVEVWETAFLRRILRDELIWDLYLVCKDVPLSQLTLQRGEVSDARWVTPEQLGKMVERGEFFFYPELWQVLRQVEGLAAAGAFQTPWAALLQP